MDWEKERARQRTANHVWFNNVVFHSAWSDLVLPVWNPRSVSRREDKARRRLSDTDRPPQSPGQCKRRIRITTCYYCAGFFLFCCPMVLTFPPPNPPPCSRPSSVPSPPQTRLARLCRVQCNTVKACSNPHGLPWERACFLSCLSSRLSPSIFPRTIPRGVPLRFLAASVDNTSPILCGIRIFPAVSSASFGSVGRRCISACKSIYHSVFVLVFFCDNLLGRNRDMVLLY